MTRKGLIDRASKRTSQEIVLGGGLEPPCLSAYAPQTYVSAISPPERLDAQLKFPQTATAGKCRVDSSYSCSAHSRARNRGLETNENSLRNEVSAIRD